MTTQETREEILTAVEAADVCCPEQVCDVVLAAAESGRDWKAELAQAIANDASERKTLGIETMARKIDEVRPYNDGTRYLIGHPAEAAVEVKDDSDDNRSYFWRDTDVEPSQAIKDECDELIAMIAG